ncbi:MAG: hypothetical protein R3274_05225, partial [Desulfobacterales bacterium]|nr:hypothetical protein [Desulfobacterales bacterium]
MKEGLAEFGIEIPLSRSRAATTFAKLERHPALAPKIDQWHINRINETVTRNDLLRVHSADYVNRLYSDRLDDEIIKTFELIDE